jgi:hypothetical protein
MNRKPRKLALSRETLSSLDPRRLVLVDGRGPTNTNCHTCEISCPGTCDTCDSACIC